MDVLLWALRMYALICLVVILMAYTTLGSHKRGHHHYCFAARTTVWLPDNGTCPVCGRY